MKECIIYGAGQYGKMAFEEYKDRMKVIFFVDSNENRWGGSFCGLEIKPPSAIGQAKDKLVLIAIKSKDESFNDYVRRLGAAEVKSYYPNTKFDVHSLPNLQRENSGILFECTQFASGVPYGNYRLFNCVTERLYKLAQDITPVMVMDKYIVTSLAGEHKLIKLLANDKLIVLNTVILGGFYDKAEVFPQLNIKCLVLIPDLYCLDENYHISSFIREASVKRLNRALSVSWRILCYSETVALEIERYYRNQKILRSKPLEIYLFPLGCDISRSSTEKPRKIISDYLDNNPVFLMVGTICAHKGYDVVLEALQKDGIQEQIKIIILGQYNNTANEKIKNEIESAMQKTNSVLWISDATDDELSYCYEHASALIQASRIEGYGLPLVEASQHGLPIICSDIPIFREVTCGYANFFKVGDADSLAETIKAWLTTDVHPDSSRIPLHTWNDSAKTLMDIVEERAEPYLILE